MINLEKIFNKDLLNIIVNSFAKLKRETVYKLNKENEKYRDVYNELIGLLETYAAKLSGYPSRYIPKIIKNSNVEIVITDNRPINNYVYLEINPVTLEPTYYIVVEFNNLENSTQIDIEEIKDKFVKVFTYNIRDILYSLYQEFIRYILIRDFNKVQYDYELISLASHILSGFILKIFGKKYAPTIDDGKIKLLNLFTTYIIFTHYFKRNPKDAITATVNMYQNNPKYKDIIDKFKQLTQTIKINSYTSLKDFGSLLDDVGILNVPGVKFTMILSNEIGIKNLIDLLASFPSLVCNFIIARYPVNYISKKMLVGDLNQKLEDYVIKHYA